MAAPLVDGSPCIVHYGSGLLGEPLEQLVGRVPGAWPDVILVMHAGDPNTRTLRMAPFAALSAMPGELGDAALGVAGVCLFGADGLARASAAAWAADQECDFRNVADRLAQQGGSWDSMRVNGWREYGGDPLDLLELNRLALDRLENDPIQPGSQGNRIEGRVRIHPRATVRSSVIVGPTVIGARRARLGGLHRPLHLDRLGGGDRGRRDRALDRRCGGIDHARRRALGVERDRP